MASKYVQSATGVTPGFGGKHVGNGSCNYLLSLGYKQYLEVFSPEEIQDGFVPLSKDEWCDICRTLETPKPYTFCVATNDLQNLKSVLEHYDIVAEGPSDWQRVTADGSVLKWRLLTCDDSRFGPSLPFFIQWDDDCVHPSETAPAGCHLTRLTVGSPLSEELSAVFDSLNLDIPVYRSDLPAIQVELKCPKGLVTV